MSDRGQKDGLQPSGRDQFQWSIAGLILAGGRSRRFGRDKANEYFRGRRLINWSIKTLTPQVEKIFIAGRSHLDFAMVPDRPSAGLGPLGGLAGGLRIARETGHSHVLSLPCDTPLVPEKLIDTLCRSPTASYIAGCPVIGIWPVTLGFGLEAYLERGGDRSVSAWAGTVGAVPLADFDRIENVNRPEDLARINPTTATSARSKH